MQTRRSLLMLCALALLGAGCGVPADPSPTPSERPILTLDDVDAEPVERREEAVALAFDPDAAAELVAEVPADLDFDAHALVCVFLGPRLTTGWSLDLRTASLSGGELRIRARETAPRTDTRPQTTYPADCGLLSRSALPPGELRVWADDTVTDEFIADTVIEVPAPSSGG
ncbi:MAG TPA: hypothetical protein VF071_01510 [Candidatus Limnocylindria bacterium]